MKIEEMTINELITEAIMQNRIYDQNDSPTAIGKADACEAQILSRYSALEEKVKELVKYSNKLADGFPEGMLPKDIENVKNANAELASENASLKSQVEDMKYTIRLSHGWLKEYSNDADNGTHAKRILHNAILSWKPNKE